MKCIDVNRRQQPDVETTGHVEEKEECNVSQTTNAVSIL